MQKQPNGPVRLRLSRARGFRLQEHSRAVNGLPAIVVARPTRWGNPFAHVRPPEYRHKLLCYVPTMAPIYMLGIMELVSSDPAIQRYNSATAFRMWLNGRMDAAQTLRAAARDQLPGYNLACWCPLDCHCHADTLLEIANAETA